MECWKDSVGRRGNRKSSARRAGRLVQIMVEGLVVCCEVLVCTRQKPRLIIV